MHKITLAFWESTLKSFIDDGGGFRIFYHAHVMALSKVNIYWFYEMLQ